MIATDLRFSSLKKHSKCYWIMSVPGNHTIVTFSFLLIMLLSSFVGNSWRQAQETWVLCLFTVNPIAQKNSWLGSGENQSFGFKYLFLLPQSRMEMAWLSMNTKIQKSTLDISVVWANVNFLILYPSWNVITTEWDKVHLWNILPCIILFNYFQSQNLKKKRKKEKSGGALHHSLSFLCRYYFSNRRVVGSWAL